MIAADLLFFLRVYFFLFLFQIIALPFLFFISEKFKFIKDAFWGFARFFVLLILSFLLWELGHLGIPINNVIGIYSLFFIFLFASLYFLRKKYKANPKYFLKFWKKYKNIILIEEIVFILSLLFLTVIRGFQPEILGLEKFMDAGFVQAYLKSPTLPAKDIWLANETINYYSFGHFYSSVLVQLWKIDLAFSYNFLLATVFAFLNIQLFSLAFNLRSNIVLTKKKKSLFKASVSSGVLAVFLVALGGNGHIFWYFFEKKGFEYYWYPDATRFIEGTIHEFPAYSFVVSDLHAHVLSLPLVLLILLLIFIWLRELMSLMTKRKISKIFREKFFTISLLIGFIFGVLAMTNTWDMMIYGVFLVFISLILLLWKKDSFLLLFTSALAVFATTLLTVFFWYMSFTSIAEGVFRAAEHSPLWQLLVLWGPHLFWALISFLISLFLLKKAKGKDKSIFIFMIALFILILFLIIFPEFFYFKDIYKSHPRANTMFKLVFQAFMMIGLILSVFFSVIPFIKNKRTKFFSWRSFDLRNVFSKKNQKLFFFKTKFREVFILYLPITFFLFLSCLVYPYLAYKSYYRNFSGYRGLDGLAWFEKTSPEDFALMNYLKENEKQQVNILEATGESYTQFARVSAFSGMSTVLGWRVHEWLWRGGWEIPGQRTGEIREIYTNPKSKLSAKYLQQYQVKYIVVGDKEREAYSLDLQGLLSLGEVVLKVGRNYLIEIK